MVRTVLGWTAVLLCCAAVSVAQGDDSAGASDKDLERVEEVLVVTASRTEQRLQEAPAAMSVITAEELETAPADDFGDLLRNIPGVNVSQISARDVQITSRGATNSLATSQLVLVDNRSIYLDFFGFVIWEFLPSNPYEIKQIEVVRGPGSAVWGANAQTGVINVITKSPREMQGGAVTVGGGELGTAFGSVTYATAAEKLGFKVSAGYYEQDPYDRPTGLIPGTSTPYPNFPNQGTSQPKIDLRWDYDLDESSTVKFSTGYAATDGIIHTGIGPFDIQSSSSLSYAQVAWSKQAKRLGFFVNNLDGEGDNLLTVGPDGRPLNLGFSSRTYNLDYSDTRVVADKHIFTYGATARKNDFDLTIAPQGSDRDEYGVFVQDEILIGDRLRWLIGSRVDNIDPIGNVVSPRTSLMFSPSPDHTFRVSFNRAFRSPSVINNYLDITIINLVQIPVAPGVSIPYVFPTRAIGNVDLVEERLDAVEVGYVGSVGDNMTMTLAAYENKTTEGIDFFTLSTYTGSNPPPNFPLPPQALDVPPPFGLAGVFPSAFSYRNVGEQINRGVEFSLDGDPSPDWSWFFNYSWQDKPDVTGIPFEDVGLPPENRANLGLAYNGDRFFWSGNVNYQDDAFWTDVLDARFHGPTEAFTQLNLGFGVWFSGGKGMFRVDAQNATDEYVQQHVFGDIISRKVTGRVSFRF
jgi:outer membrane receptor protein involved in Fe transport